MMSNVCAYMQEGNVLTIEPMINAGSWKNLAQECVLILIKCARI